MGYDLSMEERPKILEFAHESVMENDAATVEQWREYHKLEDRYHASWRESIWTMGRFRAVVAALDMLAERDDSKVNDVLEGPIPVQRLSCNSGWLVSAEQCSRMSARLSEMLLDGEEQRNVLIHAYTQESVDVDWELEAGFRIVGAADEAGLEVAVGVPMTSEQSNVINQLIMMQQFFSSCSKHGGFRVW